jgi:hypothetical protein
MATNHELLNSWYLKGTIMPPLSLWKGVAVKTNDFKFVDRVVAEQYRIGGTEFYIHKLMGVNNQGAADPLTVNLDQTGNADPTMTIQDVLNMENRDRKYDPDIYSMKGHYQISDTEFDLRQFGLFLSNDTIFITFHLNNMVDQLGRTLMSGDVVEILHRRDDLVLGSPAAISKFYVVDEGTRPAEGYSPTWWPHLWRVKCNPITDSQEFRDILQQPLLDASGDPIPKTDGSGKDTTLQDIFSTRNSELAINDAIVTQAEAEVPFRYYQAQHFYILPGQDPNMTGNDIWTGDGIPPNGSKPVNNGTVWPTSPLTGDYFLRTDYSPPQLFKRDSGKWTRVQTAWRNPWQPANQRLVSFINNTNITTLTDGSQIAEQQNLRTAIKPKLDPDIT